jgi:hypothetical protein
MPALRAWIDVLDGIEHGIDACERRYIAGDDADIPQAVVVPPDLGPLPSALEDRARAVLGRLRDTEAKLARIPRPGAPSRRTRFAVGAHEPATFEHRM